MIQAISVAPIPFAPKFASGSALTFDGTDYYIKDGWARTPPFEFSTRGLPSDADGRKRWRGLVVALDALREDMSRRWCEQIKTQAFRPILDQIEDISIQGPAWFEVAASEQWPELIRALLARGLDPRKPGPDGKVPMVSACALKDDALFKELVSRWGSPLAVPRAEMGTPLSRAIESGNVGRVQWLLKMGADPDETISGSAQEGIESLPIAAAVYSGNPGIVQAMIDGRARIPSGLFEIAETQDDARVKEILEKALAETHQAK